VLFAGNAGDAPTVDRRMLDGHGVTLLSSIEKKFGSDGIPNVPVILELHQQESINFLNRFPITERPPPGSQLHSGSSDTYMNHPRFASGGVWTASCLGALLARAYYTPGWIELLEALVLGSSTGQTSWPWQISLPRELSGSTYGDLTVSFLEKTNSSLVVGLYRKCWPMAGNGACYLVTNPPVDTALRDDDLIIVLGTEAFAKDCFKEGLIVGGKGAPLPEDVEELTYAAPQKNAANGGSALLMGGQTHVQIQELTDLLADSRAREESLKAQLSAKDDELAESLRSRSGLEAKFKMIDISAPRDGNIPSARARSLREQLDAPPNRCNLLCGSHSRV